MNRYLFIFLACLFMQFNTTSYADVCPPTNDNPHRAIPEGWKKYPYTIDEPQSAANTSWEGANILITPTGVILGVSCDYKYRTDRNYFYTIWKESDAVSRKEGKWLHISGTRGYYCKSNEDHDVNQCQFDISY